MSILSRPGDLAAGFKTRLSAAIADRVHDGDRAPQHRHRAAASQAAPPLLENPNIGSYSSSPRYFAGLGTGTAVFMGFDTTHGLELWVTDDTGVRVLADLNPGPNGSL